MKRKYFILVLLLLSVGFWNVKPIGKVLAGNMGIFVTLAYIIFAGIYYYYHRRRPLLLLKDGYCKPVLWVFVAVLLSFVPAYLNYGQGLMTSVFASKSMVVYLAFPVLLIVRPSFKDIKWAVYAFSIVYFIVTVLNSLGLPILEEIEDRGDIAEGDFVYTLDGIHYVGIAFIFSLEQLKNRIDSYSAIVSFSLFGIILMVQNRSTLFPCALFLLYFIFTIKHKKYRYLIRTLVIAVAITICLITFQSWIALFEETSSQIGDDSYNRNLAFAYYLFEACPGELEYIIGNGYLSSQSTPIMQDMMLLGVYNSDVGFVGLWNQYGIIPVIVFGAILVKVIFSEKYSTITKFNAWFIFCCSLTTAYFVSVDKIPWVCLLLYMYSLENYMSKIRYAPHNKSTEKPKAFLFETR